MVWTGDLVDGLDTGEVFFPDGWGGASSREFAKYGVYGAA